METDVMQPEETAVVSDAAEETAHESTEELSREQAAEFEKAFDDDETSGETDEETLAQPEAEKRLEVNKEAEGDPRPQAEETSGIVIDGKRFTENEIRGLLEMARRAQEAPPERTLIERLAMQAGMSPDDFMQNAENMIVENKIAARVEQLLEQGLSEDMARHVAQVEQKLAAGQVQQAISAQERKRQSEESAGEERIRAQIREFNEQYPDVGMPPDEVFEDIRKTGVSPVVAYQRYLLGKKEAELAKLRQEQKNRENTPGSVRGRGVEVEDPFLVELMK